MALVDYDIFSWCYISSNSVVLKREAILTHRGHVAVSGAFHGWGTAAASGGRSWDAARRPPAPGSASQRIQWREVWGH